MTLSNRLLFFFLTFLTIAIISGITQAQAMDLKTASDLLGKSIKEAAGLKNDVRVDLMQGRSTIEQLNDGALAVTKIDFDTTTGVFQAYLSANENLPFTAAGRFYEVAKVPVLARKVDKNEIIAKEDIAYLDIDASKVRSGYITDETQLIGKSPVRALLKSRPIMENQVAEYKVIERNKLVTMVYKDNVLSISAPGIALQSGSVGNVIKFKNAASSKLVMAKVIDADTVEIQQANSQLASN